MRGVQVGQAVITAQFGLKKNTLILETGTDSTFVFIQASNVDVISIVTV